MTRFNPEKTSKTPEEWSAIALNATKDNHLQWNVIGGLILGALAASAASPLTGGLVAAYFLWDSWKKAGEIQRNQAAIAGLGCVAQVLDGDDFADYTRQAGKDAVFAELKFATGRGLALSAAAADFLEESHSPPTPPTSKSLMATAKTLLEKAGLQVEFQTDADTYDPTASAKIDILGEMTQRIGNTIVIGIPGSGKGMLISNALRIAKRKHPNLKVFVIDPKNDPKEAGYFNSCDVLKSFACMDAKPSVVAAWTEDCFNKYSEYAQQNERTLLIVDEGTMLGNKLQQAKSTLLVDKLTSYTSGGDSAGRNVWFLMQSPYVGGASLNLSTTSQMTSIVIAFSENIGALDQWKGSKIFKNLSLDTVRDLVKVSPIGRAIYYGKTGEWYTMPELENHSGYNRDKREYLPPFTPQNNTPSSNSEAVKKLESSLDINEQGTTIQPQNELSDLAKRLLSFFDNAKNKEPKTLADIKKKDELREQGDIKLITALSELVNAGQLIFNEEDSWFKSNW
ncbi:MAG: type IV secretory system conjugative DNA transfer family protein [Hassallia sp.]